MSQINITFGWSWMLVGVVIGMLIGLRAESSEWAEGYGSLKRRALRLGHISALALPLINILYGLMLNTALLGETMKTLGGSLMILSAVLMPVVCIGTAYCNHVKYLFPIPASSAGVAIAIMAVGQIRLLIG